MADNLILPFAETDTGENLLSQAEYKIDKQRQTGNQPGVARSTLVNKALKQSSLIAAAVAEFMAAHADEADPDVSDTLTVEEGAAFLEKAISKIASMGGSGLPEGGEAGQALVIGENGPAWRFVSGDPIGTIIAFAGKEAPKGFLSINFEVETVVPVASYKELAEIVYCGDEHNETADFFYRCSNTDGTGRRINGAYVVLPAAGKYFLRGRDASGAVHAYQYQDWAIENITGAWNTTTDFGIAGRTVSALSGPFSLGVEKSKSGLSATQGPTQSNALAFDASHAVKTAEETRPMNFSVMWCIKAWDAPVNQGNLDVQELANAWEAMSGTKVSVKYLDEMTAIIYPNGGTEEMPADVSPNQRYVMDNPFEGYFVHCEAQVLFKGKWGAAGWSTSTGSAHGTQAHQLFPDHTLIVQTGKTNVVYTSNLSGSPFGMPDYSVALEPYPCRVLVTRLGKIPSFAPDNQLQPAGIKIFSIIGSNAEVIDRSSKPATPAGHIQMKERRPGPDYLAHADGTWASPDYATAIWEKIKALRAEKQAGGIPVEYEGQSLWFDSDSDSRTQQQALFGLGDFLPQGIEWKTLPNDFITMTPQLATAITAATIIQDDAIFASAEKHRLAMLELDDPTDYDFTTGWPQTYQDVVDEAARAVAEAITAQLTPEPVDENTLSMHQPAVLNDKVGADEMQALQNDVAEMKAQFASITSLLERLESKLD